MTQLTAHYFCSRAALIRLMGVNVGVVVQERGQYYLNSIVDNTKLGPALEHDLTQAAPLGSVLLYAKR